MGLFPFRVEWVFSASKRDTQAVTEPMGDAKVELGDGVTISQFESHVMCALAACPCGTVTSQEAARRMRTATHGHPHLWAINWAG